MRLLFTAAVTVGLMLTSAVTASAISISIGNPSATTLNVGQSFTIDVTLDTQGETQVTSVFASVFADPALFNFVSGTSPGQILFNASTLEGVAKASDPFTIFSDPNGFVRAASFATANATGSGVASNNQLLATLTFQAVGAGAAALDVLFQNGDDVTVAQTSVTGTVATGSSGVITVVPEPGTALLMGLGLFGIAASGRRA